MLFQNKSAVHFHFQNRKYKQSPGPGFHANVIYCERMLLTFKKHGKTP